MKRATYRDCDQKTRLRKHLFNKAKGFKSLVGLAGPDIEAYIPFVQSYGIRNIQIYENNRETLLLQIYKIQKHNLDINLINSNIGEATYQKGVLYDLDYCCTIRSVMEDVSKFRDNFIMTFSVKDRCSQIETVRLFLEARGEQQWGNLLVAEDGSYLIRTFENRQYKCYKYKSGMDGKASMTMTVITSFL